jgi:hypothetical protein
MSTVLSAVSFSYVPWSRAPTFAASASSDSSATMPMFRSSPPPYTEAPEGGATAKSCSPWSCWRCTNRKPRRSNRNAIAELEPTPSFTCSQSSPDVLSTTAQACSSSFPSLPTMMRYVGFQAGASVT